MSWVGLALSLAAVAAGVAQARATRPLVDRFLELPEGDRRRWNIPDAPRGRVAGLLSPRLLMHGFPPGFPATAQQAAALSNGRLLAVAALLCICAALVAFDRAGVAGFVGLGFPGLLFATTRVNRWPASGGSVQ